MLVNAVTRLRRSAQPYVMMPGADDMYVDVGCRVEVEVPGDEGGTWRLDLDNHKIGGCGGAGAYLEGQGRAGQKGVSPTCYTDQITVYVPLSGDTIDCWHVP